MPKEYSSLDSLDNEVLFVLGMRKGEGRAIPRWELVVRIYGEDVVTEETRNDDNLYDRAVRKSIERLRQNGHHICNRGNGAGYYIADSREEYEKFKEYYLGPAYPKFQAVKVMDAEAERRWGKQPKPAPEGQVALFG